jgi:subtilisin family serine protease
MMIKKEITKTISRPFIINRRNVEHVARRYFIIIPIFVFCLACLSACSNDDSLKRHGLTKDDWGFYNFGQVVKNHKGTAGIDINIVPVWENSIFGSKDVIVAVVDTGVDYSIGILKDSVCINTHDPIDNVDNDHNGYIDDNVSWDFYNNDNSVYDDFLYDYHGTYICSIISKVAPGINLLPVKFMKGSSGVSDDAVRAIDYAISRGARIINCSWNVRDDNAALFDTIKNNPDVLFVSSAGNTRVDFAQVDLYPPSYRLGNVITVMSIDNTGEIYEMSGFGSDVDIAAPGVDIKVIFPENDSDYIDGTSVSAAFVSGASALLWSIEKDLSPAEIKKRLMDSAMPLPALNGKCRSNGCLNIYKCIDYNRIN